MSITDKTMTALHAMTAKGVDICGVLTVDGADLIMGDGTNIKSIVREAEIMRLPVDESGDPITDGSAAPGTPLQHFLKLTRGFGDVVYKPVQGVNDLLKQDDLDGKVESLPEVAAQLQKLTNAINAAKDSLRLTQETEVSQMELAFDNFLDELRLDLIASQNSIINYAKGKDLVLAEWSADVLATLEDHMVSVIQHNHFCESMPVASLSAADSPWVIDVQVPMVSLPDLDADGLPIYDEFGNPVMLAPQPCPDRMDVSKWDIRAKVVEADGKVKNASVLHDVVSFAGPPGGIRVTVDSDSCMEQMATAIIVITGVFCGDQVNICDPMDLPEPGYSDIAVLDAQNLQPADNAAARPDGAVYNVIATESEDSSSKID